MKHHRGTLALLAISASVVLVQGTAFSEPPGINNFAETGSGGVGSRVVISGGYLWPPREVWFNGVRATWEFYYGQHQIVAFVPLGATTGPVTVTTEEGSATSPIDFVVTDQEAPGRINLSWNDCGAFGSNLKAFACDLNIGPTMELFGSFVPPPGLNDFVGMVTRLQIQSSSPTLPDWWKLGAGECRGGLSASDFDYTAGPSSCADPYSVTVNFGGHVWETGATGVDRTQLLVQASIPSGNAHPLDPGTEYYAFTIRITRGKSTGAGSCGGCNVAGSIRMSSIDLYHAGTGDYVKVAHPDLRNAVSWTGGSAVDVSGRAPQRSLALAQAEWGDGGRGLVVSLALASESPAQLEVFDVGGRLVAARSLAGFGPGIHRVHATADGSLASGVYFVRLTQDGHQVAQGFPLSH